MMRCDCKSYPHDDWCDAHPQNELKTALEEMEQKIEDLMIENAGLRDDLKKLSQLIEEMEH